jgi:hypothetical protein
MEFLLEFNDKLIKQMFYYKTCSKETFNYKKFSSTKTLIATSILQGNFKKKVINKKKDILKKNIIFRLLTNNESEILLSQKNNFKIKKNTITNVENKINVDLLYPFLKNWFFCLNPFFQENEMSTISNIKSIRKNFDSFKTIRLLNSRIMSSSFFNFELTLKISFKDENSSDIFLRNYEC